MNIHLASQKLHDPTSTWEARFVFSPEIVQTGFVDTESTLIACIKVADRSDDNLRNMASQFVKDPTWHELSQTHYLCVDIGLHKDSGGLGASHPSETLILRHPEPLPPLADTHAASAGEGTYTTDAY
tara:strand:+ start:621 stop:1001 length:381 start_codon:yes stop_codon:yes gene_type:complete